MKTRLLILVLMLFSVKNLFALKPDWVYHNLPDRLGLKYTTSTKKFSNDISLKSWDFLQDDPKKPFVIISYGDAWNMSYNLYQAKMFFKNRYNVIMYDYRGFGESSDFEMNSNMLYFKEFEEDLKSFLKDAKKRYHPKSIILYGLSMGTIISVDVASHDYSIDNLILDSFVQDPELVVKRIYELNNKEILLPEDSKSYKERIKTIKTPILLFSGLKDNITTEEDARKMLSLNPQSEIVSWDCSHMSCFYEMTKTNIDDLYFEKVNDFEKKLDKI